MTDSELKVKEGSESGHCCFEFSVLRKDAEHPICECFHKEDAQLIVTAVNSHQLLVDALEWYADWTKYSAFGGSCQVLKDKGRLAKATLKAARGE